VRSDARAHRDALLINAAPTSSVRYRRARTTSRSPCPARCRSTSAPLTCAAAGAYSNREARSRDVLQTDPGDVSPAQRPTRPRRRCSRAGLEPGRRSWNVDFSNVTSTIMLPAALTGHRLPAPFRPAVQHNRIPRCEDLVPGKHEEVRTNACMFTRRCAPTAPRRSTPWRRPGAPADDLLRRRHRPQRVGHLRHRNQFRLAGSTVSRTHRAGSDRIVHGSPAAPRRLGINCCHGTMFAWCSRCEMTISSPR